MLKAYKYRIEPNIKQAELINKHIGSCRFLFNLALETKQLAYSGNKKYLNFFDLANQLPDLKEECTWLSEINSQSLQMSLRNLESAFTKFFKGQADFPNFKSKKGKQSFQIPQHTEVDFKEDKIFLPKFKDGIKIILHRKFKGQIKTITISRTTTGKYFASILVDNKRELPKPKKIKSESAIGVDLGLKSFIVTSDGLKTDNPRYLRESLERINVLKRRMRNKKKGSKKQKIEYNKIAVLYEKSVNQRKDFLHKLSMQLIKNHDTVCIEDLNVKGMSARCKPKKDEKGKYISNGQSAKSGLNKSILDAGWSMFVSMLEYKAQWYGKNILQIGRWEASSKTCSCCGAINHALTLKDREWLCASCGTLHDRDICGAVNIKSFALKNHSGSERASAPAELPTLVGTMKREASIPLG